MLLLLLLLATISCVESTSYARNTQPWDLLRSWLDDQVDKNDPIRPIAEKHRIREDWALALRILEERNLGESSRHARYLDWLATDQRKRIGACSTDTASAAAPVASYRSSLAPVLASLDRLDGELHTHADHGELRRAAGRVVGALSATPMHAICWTPSQLSMVQGSRAAQSAVTVVVDFLQFAARSESIAQEAGLSAGTLESCKLAAAIAKKLLAVDDADRYETVMQALVQMQESTDSSGSVAAMLRWAYATVHTRALALSEQGEVTTVRRGGPRVTDTPTRLVLAPLSDLLLGAGAATGARQVQVSAVITAGAVPTRSNQDGVLEAEESSYFIEVRAAGRIAAAVGIPVVASHSQWASNSELLATAGVSQEDSPQEALNVYMETPSADTERRRMQAAELNRRQMLHGLLQEVRAVRQHHDDGTLALEGASALGAQGASLEASVLRVLADGTRADGNSLPATGSGSRSELRQLLQHELRVPSFCRSWSAGPPTGESGAYSIRRDDPLPVELLNAARIAFLDSEALAHEGLAVLLVRQQVLLSEAGELGLVAMEPQHLAQGPLAIARFMKLEAYTAALELVQGIGARLGVPGIAVGISAVLHRVPLARVAELATSSDTVQDFIRAIHGDVGPCLRPAPLAVSASTEEMAARQLLAALRGLEQQYAVHLQTSVPATDLLHMHPYAGLSASEEDSLDAGVIHELQAASHDLARHLHLLEEVRDIASGSMHHHVVQAVAQPPKYLHQLYYVHGSGQRQRAAAAQAKHLGPAPADYFEYHAVRVLLSEVTVLERSMRATSTMHALAENRLEAAQALDRELLSRVQRTVLRAMEEQAAQPHQEDRGSTETASRPGDREDRRVQEGNPRGADAGAAGQGDAETLEVLPDGSVQEVAAKRGSSGDGGHSDGRSSQPRNDDHSRPDTRQDDARPRRSIGRRRFRSDRFG